MSEGRVVHVLSGAAYDLYIGRAMPRYGLESSFWQNPYKIGKGGTREEVLEKFEALIRRWLTDDPIAAHWQNRRLAEMYGQTLACWCAPKDGTPLTLEDEEICHGQVLLRLAKELS